MEPAVTTGEPPSLSVAAARAALAALDDEAAIVRQIIDSAVTPVMYFG